MNSFFCKNLHLVTMVSLLSFSTIGNAAVTLDRTRVVFEGTQKATVIAISNKNKKLPYLAQAWMENHKGEKIQLPFTVLPPLQRLEPEQSSQIRVEALQQVESLPQDRETLFYFNLREIPPKSEKPNVLQIALQSKIKFFYRPKQISMTATELINNPWQEKLVLIKRNGKVIANNPTPYFVTLLGIRQSKNGAEDKSFQATMIAPMSEEILTVSPDWIQSKPIITYINDYGGRPQIQYECQSTECHFLSQIKD